jgi:hypothetical protein
VALHAFFHACMIACELSVLPSPFAPSFVMSRGPAGTDGAPPTSTAAAGFAAGFVAQAVPSSAAHSATIRAAPLLLLLPAFTIFVVDRWFFCLGE